tara:strand:- start:57 stop:860 length:804 start_codon:yes stop_codon:yes gene_type:complete
MQLVQRYLLSQLVIAYVNGYHGRNSNVYDRRLTLHRGVDNPVTFTFKNEDQKAQDITSKTYEFNMIDTESKKAVITKTLTILDDGSTVSTKGDASCTITEGDLLSLDAKFYNFSVREVASDNSRTITYSGTGYAAAGSIELLDGAYPEFTASTSVSSFTASGGPLANTSSNIDARPGINNNKALHTIAVYTTNFSGSLRVQGTMASSPGSSDFFDITMDGAASSTNTFSSSTTVTNFNFFGVYHSIRFSWDNDASNTGKIDKILYRQ